ncbi:hypothetical protein BY996DRAFT_6570166 [Phakopsora pachyrhizi]|nr:hypothetical protein BY996DRAFT_6570166 [Phakopsora pachyrhizi]
MVCKPTLLAGMTHEMLIIPIRLRPIGTIHLHNHLVTISINLKKFKKFIYSKSSLNQTNHLGPIRFSTTTNHLKDHNLPLSRHQEEDQFDSSQAEIF